MKVTLLGTHDIGGGAHIAAYRLHRALLGKGVDSKYCVAVKRTDDFTVIGPTTYLKRGWAMVRPLVDRLPQYFYGNRSDERFSPSIVPTGTVKRAFSLKPDIVHLHWITDGFIRIEELARFKQPLVWTLHDMWPFTGGCHYDKECGRFRNACGKCPILGSNQTSDLSRKIVERKQKAWKKLNLTVITPSRWMADCAKNSMVFRHKPVMVIPYSIDLEIFKPRDKKIARQLLGLPMDKKLILFGALNSTSAVRKGFHLLKQALEGLTVGGDRTDKEIIVFGASTPQNPPDLGLKKHYLGHLHDEISLSLVYAAADVFVAPSSQDNLPNTVIEAIASGTPCVAFDIGGLPDIIEHRVNGYLARPFDPRDLARGIFWVLDSKERHRSLSIKARKKAEKHYHPAVISNRYVALYKQILQKQVTF